MASIDELMQIIEHEGKWKKRKESYDELGRKVKDRRVLERMRQIFDRESGKDRDRVQDSAYAAFEQIEERLKEKQLELTEPREVSEASEDALLLKLEEKQEGKIILENNTVEISSSGQLIVQNLGEKDRIWDIDITIRKIGDSDLKEKYLIQELSPGGEWIQDYAIKQKKGAEGQEGLPFEFTELINTQPSQDEPSNVLVFGNEMETHIKLSIKAKKDFSELTIKKEILGHFSNPQIAETSVGDANIEEGNLVWKIPEIKEGEEASVSYQTVINVEDIDPKRTGTAEISSVSKVEGALSHVDLGRADGLTKNYVYIEADEMIEEPDNWTCKIVVENPSEFPVELHNVKVWEQKDDKGTEGSVFFEKEFDPEEVIVLPGDSWESPEEWTYHCEDVPEFKKSVFFTVKPEILYTAESLISVEDLEMPVAKLAGVKKYGLEVLPSYRETPVPTMLRFANTGSLELKETIIRDHIPEGLQPPESGDVKVYVIETSGDESDLLEDPPEDDSGLIKETHVDFGPSEEGPGQQLNVTIARVIKPNEVIYLYYEPIAQKPSPENTFEGEGHLTAHLAVPAPPLELDVVDWLSQKTITVSHLRRRITSGKQVFPGSAEGEYEIVLVFKNRGDTDLENLSIKDFLPEDFDLLNESLESEEINAKEGTIRKWTVEMLEAGNDTEITYTIKGTGDYKVGKAQVSY